MSVRESLIYKKNDGRITLKALIWILILSSVLYLGYKFSNPYFSYYMIRAEVREEVKLSHIYTDGSIRRMVAEQALAWDVPITADDVQISRDFENITIKLEYTKTITFFGRFKKKLVFKVKATAKMKPRRWMLK